MPRHLTCTMQVHGNPCPQQLPPAPTLEAPQKSCSLSRLPPTMTRSRSRGSLPAHPMTEMFPSPGLVPESLALARKDQIVRKAQVKRRILPLLLQPSSGSLAPQVQHLQERRRSSCPSHAHLRIAGNFHAQLRHLGDLHPSLHPERSNLGLLCVLCVYSMGSRRALN